MRKLFTCLLLFFTLVICQFTAPEKGIAADDENCLMCHKYRKMGMISPNGVRKFYYVDEPTFMQTVHSRVPCRDCHYFIDRIPHNPVTQGVTCDTKCHVINPATGERFSHKPIKEVYDKSVHGREKLPEGKTEEIDKNKPYCIFCHINPIYNPAEREVGPPAEITDRCNVCHENDQFARHWYMHTARRVREVRRSSGEVVKLCNTCHTNEKLLEQQQEMNEAILGKEMSRKYTFAGEAYNESFHAKVIKYGLSDAANCLNCHAKKENYYMNVHDIRRSSDPESPVHVDNRVNTCKGCHYHGNADESFVNVDPHPTARLDDNPFIYYASIVYNIIAYVAFLGLVGLKGIETFGRVRHGVRLYIRNGSSWR